MTTTLLSRPEEGEDTGHPDLRIVPGADEGCYTGTWRVRHVPSGQDIPTRCGGASMPVQWVRRFARVLATCGIDWSAVSGDLSRVQHPQTVLLRALERYVLDCYHRGTPVGPGFVTSTYVESGGRCRLRCTNPNCEDPDAFQTDRGTAVLSYATEDGDRIEVSAANRDELVDIAWEEGWSPLGERGDWMCATCSSTHRPAPQHAGGEW